jgi:hypothetical protein
MKIVTRPAADCPGEASLPDQDATRGVHVEPRRKVDDDSAPAYPARGRAPQVVLGILGIFRGVEGAIGPGARDHDVAAPVPEADLVAAEGEPVEIGDSRSRWLPVQAARSVTLSLADA